MATKFCNNAGQLLLAVAVTMLASCAQLSTSSISQFVSKSTINGLADTSRYLPKQKYSWQGKKLDFEATANPYLNTNRVVDQETQNKFDTARTAFDARKYKKAERLLLELTARHKDLSGPSLLLGHIAFHRGHYQKAQEHYLHAKSINRHNVNVYTALARVQRHLGEFVLAQHTYAQALKQWRDFPEAHLNLAILYDVYLNQSLNAQMHMEAYQFLTQNKDKKVAQWLTEIKKRTQIQQSFVDSDAPSNTETALTSL